MGSEYDIEDLSPAHVNVWSDGTVLDRGRSGMFYTHDNAQRKVWGLKKTLNIERRQ